jgi:predicted nuclease with RNAse H fold
MDAGKPNAVTVAGIDVGAESKGFHLAILRDGVFLPMFRSTDPAALHAHCLAHDVGIVGIDAPCQWGAEGVGRTAERELARNRIFCFSTPTEERAAANTSGFYEWMFNGLRVYRAFAESHPVLRGDRYDGTPAAIETFPHAITCALLGRENVSAKKKREQRRLALMNEGFDVAHLTSIDDLDAALCAYTARLLAEGKTRAWGDAAGGYIVVPERDVTAR